MNLYFVQNADDQHNWKILVAASEEIAKALSGFAQVGICEELFVSDDDASGDVLIASE